MRKRKDICDEMAAASKRIGVAIKKHDLINDGDRLLIVLDGRFQSFCLLDLLAYRRAFAPVHYDLVILVDESRFLRSAWLFLESFLGKYDLSFHAERELSFASVDLLRAYRANKWVDDQSMDDWVESVMTSMFWDARLLSRQMIEDIGSRYSVIRPLSYVSRTILYNMAQNEGYHPDLLQYKEAADVRFQLKKIWQEIVREYPPVKKNIFNSVLKIKEEYLL